jgi:hypothetical protein
MTVESPKFAKNGNVQRRDEEFESPQTPSQFKRNYSKESFSQYPRTSSKTAKTQELRTGLQA